MAYNNQLSNLIGSEVRINRGGPDSVVGVLLGVHSDYLIIKTNDGVVYINGVHIKSISETGSNKSGRSMAPRYITAYNFSALLQRLRHSFVQINRGGPEKIEGFLAEGTQDYLLVLVKNNELVRIPIFHVKSISVGRVSNENKNDNNKNDNKNDNKNNNKKDNKSSSNQNKSNKTSGNKSSKSR